MTNQRDNRRPAPSTGAGLWARTWQQRPRGTGAARDGVVLVVLVALGHLVWPDVQLWVLAASAVGALLLSMVAAAAIQPYGQAREARRQRQSRSGTDRSGRSGRSGPPRSGGGHG
jgi:hypothetical protein